jgi:hypothetical protein
MLTEFAALCVTDFIDWRYIHSLVGIFYPGCELLPPGTNYTCVRLPLYLLSDLYPLSPLPKLNVKYIQTETVCIWGGGGGVNCAVDHILQEFFTLFLTRFRTYQ